MFRPNDDRATVVRNGYDKRSISVTRPEASKKLSNSVRDLDYALPSKKDIYVARDRLLNT